MHNYKEHQKEKQIALIRESDIFNGDEANGMFMGKKRNFVLQDGMNNLYPSIKDDCVKYFKENMISWWSGNSPSGHVLSSQIACLNHLFLIRHDKDAVLSMINGIRDCFIDVLPIPADKGDNNYIAFEVVSKEDHLNEIQVTRGSNCTSVDAFVYAKHKNGNLILLPIEWKYTELYPTGDKSNEDRPCEAKGSNGRGLVRLHRYSALIEQSRQLKSLPEYKGSVYFQEPFYQLMRQTLWSEGMIKNRDTEDIKGDDFLHIHVVPKENYELLDRKYSVSEKGMEETWINLLSDKSKYVLITPEDLLMPVRDKYPELINYLKTRYW